MSQRGEPTSSLQVAMQIQSLQNIETKTLPQKQCSSSTRKA